MSATTASRPPRWRWFDARAGAILIVGLGLGLLVSAVMLELMMEPPTGMIASMVIELTAYSGVSVIFGYILYQLAARYSRSLNLTLALTYIWAALLTLYVVWQMSRLMFASASDLGYATIFLVFAAVIATTFGISVTTRVTNTLRQVSETAQEVAAGNLEARAEVSGRDEVARLTVAFNKMAAQLQSADARREEVEALRHDLIAWTSHDLRTPLTSIRAMVEALHDGVVTDDATRQRYYRTIRADIIALNQLIDDLSELAQLDSGGLTLDLSDHSLTDLVSDTVERFHPLAEQRGITLAADIGPGIDPVRLNAHKLGRVLTNLLSNAIRYTPAGGRVDIELTRTASEVQVRVRDSGPGFAAADLPRVFEKFYRGEQARSRATGGAGLGLAIARGIVVAHHGRIWAENGADGGAIVGIALPA